MKKVLVHAKLGHVVVASFKEDGEKISVVSKAGKFLAGESESTIPNTMEVLAEILERFAGSDEIVQVAVIGAVAEKVNSTMLVKEFWKQEVLSNKRALSKPELETYSRLIKAISQTYGQVIIESEQFISKSIKAGQTQDQADWANLFIGAEKVIKGKTATAPKVAEKVDPLAGYGDEGEEEVAL